MKKVLIVCGKLRIGGAEKVAYELGIRRNPERLAVDYVVFENDIGEYERELEETGCRIFHIPSPSSGYLQFMNTIRSLIRTNHYDAVHCHTMFNSGLVLAAAKSEKVPVRIAHSHTIRSRKNMGTVQELYQHAMRKLIHLSATDFVACGNEAGEWLYGQRFYKKRGQLILNGIDVRKFRFSETDRMKIRNELNLDNQLVIGHAGHMVGVKNQVFLIHLMKDILLRQPDARLLLLGDGDDREMLRNEIKENNLDQFVILPGNVMNIHEYYSAMDVFAFPSLYEGTPLAMLEIQANGLPCCVSDAVPQDVFITDLLTRLPLSEKDAWTEKLCSMKRIEPCSYNDIMYQSGFDISAMVEKVYRIYEKNTIRD